MKKKLGVALLATAVAFGGASAAGLIKEESASAASVTAYGVSMNTTKTTYYSGVDSWLELRIVNNNTIPVHAEWRWQRLVNGTWQSVVITDKEWLEADMAAKGYYHSRPSLILPTFPAGTYRVQLQVYSSTGVFKDEVYSDLFYVK